MEGVRLLKTNSGESILLRCEWKSFFHGASLVGGLLGLAVVAMLRRNQPLLVRVGEV